MINGDYIMVVAPPDFPGKKYRNRYCYEHHLVYWQSYGVVANSNEIIHHKDENKHNNSPENLELKTRSAHATEHGRKRGKIMVELLCPYCQIPFIIEKRCSYLQKGGYSTCCSKWCASRFNHLSEHEKQKRISKMFIREFKGYK